MTGDSSFWQTHFPQPEQAHKSSNLPELWVQNLFHHKLLKIWVPKSLGGLQCNLPQGLRILEQAAAHQGSLGWLVNLGSGTNYFGPDFSAELASEVFGPNTAWLGGSGRPSGNLIKDGNDWLLSGQWPWCTGAAHASAFTLNAYLPDGAITSVVLPAHVLVKRAHWPYAGLRLTSSWEVEAIQVRVTEKQCFNVGKRKESGWPLGDLAFNGFASFCMRASWLGMLRCFLECSASLASIKPDFARLREQLMESHAQSFELLLSAAEDFEKQSESHRLEQQLQALLSKQRQEVMQAFWCGGTRMANAESSWHNAWLDLLLCGQHSLLA